MFGSDFAENAEETEALLPRGSFAKLLFSLRNTP